MPPGEERVNMWIHIAGAAMAVAGMVIVSLSVPEFDLKRIVAFSVYLAALFLMYLASSCYHGTHSPKRKAAWRKLDHAAIYLLIAGTYTPIMLIALDNYLGMTILAVVWVVGLCGIYLKCFSKYSYGRWSLGFYLVMGWLCVVAFKAMIEGMGMYSFGLLLSGGVLYSIGAIFYRIDRPYYHAVWHLFVLGGSTLQYFALLLLL
jgi:hemolysin III